jgi:TonB-linked SusC/RagA family outer membrane protein
LLFFFCLALFLNLAAVAAADFPVRGSVTDENGPVAGVTVTEKGTSNATTTDNNGNYSITVKNANSVLVFTFVGYKTVEVAVSGRSMVNAAIESAAQELSGVVVTALGITREKKSLGYSVEEVAGKEMNRVAQENVMNAMSGKVAGVTINQTGAAGSSVSMVIRGATSLSTDNQPLFVIDGVPIANTLNNISQVGSDNRVDYGNAVGGLNPDDIESVTVLKGPSAAALYGSRAGNGVVLITTKTGKGLDRTTVNFVSNTVFEKPYKFLEWQTKYASGIFPAIPVSISGNLLTDPLGVGDKRFNPDYVIIDESGGSGGPELDRGYMAIQWNSPLDANGKPIALPLVSHPNNVKNFVQTGVTTTNGVSVANSTEKINYRVSLSDMRNRGIVPNSDLFRNTLNFNSSLKVSKNFRLSTNMDFSRNRSNNRPAGERGTNPLQWAYAVSPNNDIRDLKNYWVPGQEGLAVVSTHPSANNPYFLAYEVNNSFLRDRVYGNIKADWQISRDFSLMLRYGLDNFNEKRETKISNGYTSDPRGAYGITNIRNFESNADFLLTYKKNLNAFHISVSGGGNVRYLNGSVESIGTKDKTGLIVPGVFTIQNILPANLNYNNSRFEKGINSLYAMATVGFKDMIYLDLTSRSDFSSTLPDAIPYYYPSASLSVLLNEVLGVTSNDINLIKLRGGYAVAGNDASPYMLYSVLGNAGTWGNVPRLTTSGTLLIEDLKPELSSNYEAGIDVNLFRNRFRLAATYYSVDNKNQIFNTDLPSSTGYSSKSVNAGLLRSYGYELTVGGTPVQSRNWRWDISANLTRNRTKVMELIDEMPYFKYWDDAKGGAYTFLGEEVGDIYGPKVRVVEDKSSPYYGWPLLDGNNEDGAKWVALDGLQTKNKIGNFNPRFILGAQTSISWKSWTLSATVDWRNGGQFVSQTYRYGVEDGRASLQFDNFWDPGTMSGKELRDYLVAHADELIIPHGQRFIRIGWPSPEKASYPVSIAGYNLPYGGLIAPGVYPSGYDANGNPTGYIENLGENILKKDANGNYIGTVPLLYAVSNGWDFMEPTLFSASYVKLRELSLTYGLPQPLIKSLRIQDASFGVYTRNLILWTKAKIGIDPENAFQPTTGVQGGIQFKQGIERYNVTPWSIPVGVKLNITF